MQKRRNEWGRSDFKQSIVMYAVYGEYFLFLFWIIHDGCENLAHCNWEIVKNLRIILEINESQRKLFGNWNF